MVIAASSLVFGAETNAQGIAPKPLGPNILSGVVTDTLGAPLADVEVVVAELSRRTRTSSDGAFRFDSVKAGVYGVGARAIGLIASASRVRVGPEGGSVYIRMIRIGTYLPAVTTTASRAGLSGVIADTALRAMAGVEVTVVGGGKRVQTDSAGAFHVPLKSGQYMLRLERDGYARQVMAVWIPPNEGRQIAAWMVPQQGGADIMEGVALFDLNARLIRSSPVSSRYFTREELQRQQVVDLQQLARNWANGRITGECMVSIGGQVGQVPLWLLTTSEVEFVEVYQPSRQTFGRPPVSGSCGNLAIIAWLRR